MVLEDELRVYITNHSHVEKDKIKRETDIMNDLGADSLDRVEMMMNLEEKYKLKIPEEDAEKLKTIGDVIDYVITIWV